MQQKSLNLNPLILLRDWLSERGFYFAYATASSNDTDTLVIGKEVRWLGRVNVDGNHFCLKDYVFPLNHKCSCVKKILIADPESFYNIHRRLNRISKRKNNEQKMETNRI